MLEIMPHLHKNRIRLGRSKFHGSVLSLPFQFFYGITSIQLEVGPIIIWLVVGGVADLEENGGVWWDWRICMD